jgi:hypothetical protein
MQDDYMDIRILADHDGNGSLAFYLTARKQVGCVGVREQAGIA